jgi:hypothetical protein
VASKILTRDQAEARKAAAVRFAENVLDDPDKADDIKSESLDDWVARKRITLVDNPGKRSLEMANANMSKDELLDYIDELESENSDLQDTLDSIQDLISPPTPADDDTDTDDDDADDDDAAVNTAAAEDY